MPQLFKVKVRRVGSSLGILIPNDLALREGIREGEEIDVSLLKKRSLADLMRLIGTAKGSKPFRREKQGREDGWR